MQNRILTLIALALITFSANAQKLPAIQVVSVLAPAKVDIDGKAAEWNGFQAYNKNTGISYTLANDDKNLYLVLQSTTSANNNKIIRGGITFTVNTAGKKKGGSAVLFPVVAPMSVAALMQKMNGGQRGGGNMGSMSPEQIMKRADSIMTAANKAELAKFNEIKVKGFPSITDSLVSIYNEHGIKTAAKLDEKGAYTYELAIPLDALGLSAANTKEFNYNIMVNGIEISGMNGGGGFGGGGFGGGGFGGGPGGFGGGGGGFSDEMLAMVSAADFWGKYSLTKK